MRYTPAYTDCEVSLQQPVITLLSVLLGLSLQQLVRYPVLLGTMHAPAHPGPGAEPHLITACEVPCTKVLCLHPPTRVLVQGVSLQQLITLLSVMLPPTKCSIAPAHPGPGGGSRLTTACEVTNYTDNEKKNFRLYLFAVTIMYSSCTLGPCMQVQMVPLGDSVFLL